MKILLISDTHSHLDPTILKYVKTVDEVWHAGDIGTVEVADTLKSMKSTRAVYGNIDGKEVRAEFPLDHRFFVESMDVWMTHIGGYPNKYNPRVRDMIKNNPPNLFISGHSHILKVQYDHKLNLLYMNPGAAGKSGFHKVRTMLRFNIINAEVKDMEVIEMKK